MDILEVMEQIESYGTVTLDDGCTVEPDGTCPHGEQSPLLDLGMI